MSRTPFRHPLPEERIPDLIRTPDLNRIPDLSRIPDPNRNLNLNLNRTPDLIRAKIQDRKENKEGPAFCRPFFRIRNLSAEQGIRGTIARLKRGML